MLVDNNYEIWLKQEDIANIARTTYGWYGEDNNVVFEVIGSVEQLGIQLERYKNKLKESNKQSLTVIVNLSNNHWVTLVVAYQSQRFSAYYIDSLNSRIPDDIKSKLEEKITGINIQSFNIQQQKDDYNCGIFALKNAEIINDELKNLQQKQVRQRLSNYKPTKEQLRDERIQFAQALQQEIFNIPKPGSNDISQPKPTATNRVVKWLGKEGEYTEKQIRENPNLLFLFGDNDKAKYRTNKNNPGGDGQASVIRPTGEGKSPYDRLPEYRGLNGNGIGITTTFYDGYVPNIDEFKALMDREFAPIETWVKKGGSVVIPCND